MKSKRLLLLLLVALMAPWAAMAQNRQIVEIGTGSSTDYYPMPGYWGFQYDVYLYTPSAAPELGVDSDISSIAYNVSSSNSSTGATIEIWVKDVDASFALASSTTFADYISGATKVVDEGFTTSTTGWKTMNFSSTFSHQGGKALLVAVRGVGCSTSGGCSRKCYYTSASYMHWYKRADGTDPGTSATGSLDGNRSNIRLDVTYTGAVCFAPTNLTCTAYTTNTATLEWTENGTATNWMLEYGTDNTFATGTYSEVPVSTNPTQLTGLTPETKYYARVKPDCDTEGTKWSNVCEFKPSNVFCNEIGTGSASANLVYTSYGCTYSQHIYTASELTAMGFSAGNIVSVSFNYSGTSSSYDKTQSIYMGTTTKSSYSGYDASNFESDVTLVYGPTLLSYVAGWREYELTEPFEWDGSSNIVVGMLTNSTHSSSSGWNTYGTSGSDYRTIYRYRDSNPIDITNLSSVSNGFYSTTRPNINLCILRSNTPKPRNLVVSIITTEGATVTWEAPSSATPTGYEYQYKTSNGEWPAAWTNNGTNLTCTLSELTASTDYVVRVRANYAEGDSDPAEIQFTTEATCLPPTGLRVASLTATSVTIAWDAEEDALYQVYLPGGQPTNPFNPTTPPENSMDDWGWNTQPETGGTASWNNLLPNSHYGVWVRRYCGPNEFSDPISIEFDTPCGAYDIPYTYGFETPDLFGCWTPIAGVAIQNNSNQAHESTYALKFSGTTNNMVALPQFVNATNTLRLEFWTRPESATNSSCGNFAVGYMTDLADANSFVAVKTYAYNDWTSAVFEKKTVDFANAPENAYIAMRQYNNSSSWYWFVDDVTVKEIPSCLAPSALAADASTTSAELSWTANSGETAWTLYWKKTTDENYTEVANATNPYTLNGLTPATDYQFYVVANCSADDASEPSEVFTFATSCANIASYPWSENFDSYSTATTNTALFRDLPHCWNYINECTYSNYMYYPSMLSYEPSSYAHSGSNYMRFFSYYTSWSDYDPQPQYAILPIMENLAGKEITLWVKGYDATSSFKVGLMTTLDASTFVEITNDDNPAISTSYQQFFYVIPADATANYVAIMIEAANSSHTSNGVYIDDIEIDVAPTCFKPKNLAVTPNSITAHEATLTWQPSSNGTENAWVLQCCIDDEFMCGDAGIFEVSGTPSFTFTNFQPETTYYVRVKPDCDTEGALWSNVVSFTTAVACPAPTDFDVAENGLTGHTATLNWEGTSESYTVRYRIPASIDSPVINEKFEGTTLPDGWTHLGNGTAAPESVSSTHTYDGKPLKFSGATSDNVVVLPVIEGVNTLVIDFWSKAEGSSSGNFDLGYVTDATDASTFETLKTYTRSEHASYTHVRNYSLASVPEGARIAFRHRSGSSNWYWFIDDVVIGSPVPAGPDQFVNNIDGETVTLSGLLAETEYEAWLQGDCGSEGPSAEVGPITFTTDIACPKPTSLTYSNLKSTSVELRWVGHGEEEWLVEYMKDGEGWITREVSDSQVTPEEGGVIVYKLETLDPETEYCVKVRANCEQTYAGDGQSDYSNEECFTTTPSCAVENVTVSNIGHYTADINWDGESADGFTVKYRTAEQVDGVDERFNTTDVPEGWTRYVGLFNETEGTATLSSSSGWSFGTSNNVFDSHARVNIYGNYQRWLVTPEVTLQAGASLSFDMALTVYTSSSNASPTPGNQADDKFIVMISTDNMTTWTVLRKWDNAGSEYVYDNITNTGNDHVSIDLSSYAGANVYIAFYGESTESGGDNNLHIDNVMVGTPVPAGTEQTVSATDSPANLANLEAGKKYDVKVIPDCDESSASEWVSFTTVSADEKWFITEGNWGTASNWEPVGAPTIDQNVTLLANATIESTCVAEAKSINGTGTGTDAYTLTIKDGGKLKHLNSSVRATVEKEIRAYSTNYDEENYNNGDYYLITNPLTSNVTPDAENNYLLSGNYDLYSWNYSASDDNEWRNYEANPKPFTSLNVGAYGYLYANETGATLTYTGTINAYTSYKSRYCSASSSPENYDFPSWYLLGNPYLYDAYLANASSNGTALPYIKMNDAGDGFEVAAAGTPIEPMQGFFYQGITGSNYAYVVTYVPTVQSNSKLNMNLRRNNKQLDNAILVFGGEQQLGKMTFRANSSKIFMPVEGKDYAITSVEGQVGEVPVSFKAENNGTYSLSFTSEEVSFSYLHLIDNMTGADVNLLQTPSYTFDARTSDYESRFKLVFAVGSSANDETFGFVNASGNFCIFGIEGEATVQVIDVLGHVLSSETFSGSYEKRINGAPGVYMVRLIQGNDVKVQKVVVR